MRRVMMTAAALTAFGALVATAQADAIHGGPMKNGNQCFKYAPGNSKDGRFGSWGECPQAAATPRSTRRGRGAASVTSPAPDYPHESAQ
jgi:hypothetical protein